MTGDGTIGYGSVPPSPASTVIDTTKDASGAGANSVASVETGAAVAFGFGGFYAPVDPDTTGTVINSGKAGRTYPLKFQLKDSTGNFISNLNAVRSIKYATSTACTAGGSTNPIDYDTTSNSGLTYDTGNNQFHYNWKTPSTAGCYTLKVNLLDGTTKLSLYSLG